MIDIKKAVQEFNKYAENYDLGEPHIKRKQDHSIRVMVLSKKIAQSVSLTEEGVELATLIGLLHDIARFEQYTIYKTYRDLDSIDHGDFGVKILKENNFLRKFIDISDYDNVILKAIKNHNKFEIEPNLTQEEELFCKIIRDADKLDILFQAATMFWTDRKKLVENSKISPSVEEDFYNRNTVLRRKGIPANELDKLISMLSFVFDLNFMESFKILKEKDYINKIIDQFNFQNEETKKKMENMREIVNQYV